MVNFDFSSISTGQIIGLVLVVVIVPLGIWNMKRMQRKKLEEEDQFASMGSSEIEAPSENLGTQGDQKTSEEVSPGAVPQTGGVETPEAEIPLKTYIEQYKSQYSKEALKSALLNNGYDSTLVDTCLEKYF